MYATTCASGDGTEISTLFLLQPVVIIPGLNGLFGRTAMLHGNLPPGTTISPIVPSFSISIEDSTP